MASPIMIQGTCSGAGKSLLAAGLLRILSDLGVNAAPFKSQNMALNSYITAEGAEIGRAQALQAEAARVEPAADMNPVLLKALGDKGCQVILGGRVHGNMSAKEYYAFRDTAWRVVAEAYERLGARHDVIVIEGAGSPAEINLINEEIVNMRVARHTGAPVLVVGDIERGGVFASFHGTHALLGDDARHIKGFVINKFRGDVDILAPGLDMIRGLTGVPVIGVLPHLSALGLEEEDGLGLMNVSRRGRRGIRVAVVRLRYISNFTDFNALAYEPDVELVFTDRPQEIEHADMVIIPGSKTSTGDLAYMNGTGLSDAVRRAAARGADVAGICGGYQMLGTRITDPLGLEGGLPVVEGIGLLDIETEIKGAKVTSRSTARTLSGLCGYAGDLGGYEIHKGHTTGDVGLLEVTRTGGEMVLDGSAKGNVWGTYLHGIFDNDGLRAHLLGRIRSRRGLPVPERSASFAELKEEGITRWADTLRENLDMQYIYRLLDLEAG